MPDPSEILALLAAMLLGYVLHAWRSSRSNEHYRRRCEALCSKVIAAERETWQVRRQCERLSRRVVAERMRHTESEN